MFFKYSQLSTEVYEYLYLQRHIIRGFYLDRRAQEDVSKKMMKRRPVEIDQVSWGGKEGGRDSGRGVGAWREVSWREGRTGTSSGIGMERGVNEALPVGKTRREGGRMEVESGGEGKR